MKQLKFFLTLAFGFSMVFLFFSCNPGSETKTETTSDESIADTIDTSQLATTMPAKPGDVLIIKHKVVNFDKWKPQYEAHDSLRRSHGLSNYIIGRGMDDPNMVIVILKMDDVAKAKELTSSKDMKERMKMAGVTGTPEFDYIDVVMNDTTNIDQKARLMVKNKVKDWDAWKTSFDSHKQARMDAGLVDRGIGYSDGDNHSVTIVFAVTDKKKAEAFRNSKDLKSKMDSAGVAGPPFFFYYNIVQLY